MVNHAYELEGAEIKAESFEGFNFMLISYETWNDVSVRLNNEFMHMPSTLIIRHREVK